jgi:hypothetical protein
VSSPEVWADARARIEAQAAALGLSVIWPNEPGQEPEPVDGGDGSLPAFLSVEIMADGGEPIELGGATWEERGTVWISVLIPSGSGIGAGLQIRKALSNAFRGLDPAALNYDGFSFPPGGTDEGAGNWYRLSLGVSYSFTDR